MHKGLDALLTQKLPHRYEHEIVRRLRLAEAIGAAIPEDQTLAFFLNIQEKLPLREGKPWIAIHPGSQDRFKRWPVENFIALGKRLKEEIPECEILVTGSAKERGLMQEVQRHIPGAHLDTSNRPLRSFAALIDQMDLLISNDTGPTHLAWALKRPAISIFSPTDPMLCGPHQAVLGIAIARPPTCFPCMKRACRSPFCLLQIGVEEVTQQALSLLGRSPKVSRGDQDKITDQNEHCILQR
jgi:ADP-heptose:LPS heptosyltransferase